MTVRVTFNQTCDRCERPFQSKQLKPGETVPNLKSRGYIMWSTTTVDSTTEQSKKPVVCFEDLCDGCREAVEKMIGRIRLDQKKSPTKARPQAEVEPEPEVEPEVVAEVVAEAEAKPEPEVVEAKVEPTAPPKRKRGRPSKVEMAARAKAEAAAKTQEYTEDEDPLAPVAEVHAATEAEVDAGSATKEGEETDGPTPDEDDLGLVSDSDPLAAVEAPDGDDPFPGHETFEDPETGDVIDVHTGEVLAKRVDGGGKQAVADSAHPF